LQELNTAVLASGYPRRTLFNVSLGSRLVLPVFGSRKSSTL